MRKDIYAIVERIPTGKVASYGQIARIVGCNARQIGYALAALPQDKKIPWHRVVNSKGEISARGQADNETYQQILLLSEGIKFDQNNRISLPHFQWNGEPELS